MEHYIEYTVCCRRSTSKRVAYVILCFFAVLFLLIAAVCAASALGTSPEGSLIVDWPAVIGIAAFFLIALLCWRSKDKLFIDYDYNFCDDTINISAVYNSKKRKHLLSLNLHSVRSCGSTESNTFRKFSAQKQISCRKYYCNADKPITYFMYEEQGRRKIVLLELNDNMVQNIKRSKHLETSVWNGQEGK